ncbi:energy-coupling factor ABC transporter ATP-binding protein [Corynebacterium sp. TAE3-ERU30]|uniref:energy-coupling factor ABC transporter ATP-binding protein n=1 Tax=Corynebacterium sp. TAE3-ERU30 TaxID=2849496 RepID=UPI001C448C57|nr:ABC transporter ATP-binding protein [Corynebacterium sp. TAE3-ERU30]MBV7281089.1 energy-coupling factor ABC transporter ATP-binding protein [Corynebacterium sp. TAE3-ERU30]
MPRIVFSSASISFDGERVLDPISVELKEQRIGIIGANGGGKSSFIRLINGLGEPTSGSVSVDGLEVATHGKKVRRKVGFVFTDAENQIVMPRVEDDIRFSLKRLKLSSTERDARVEEVMKRFGLSDYREHSPHTLSGGQKQLLALAAVLVMRPEVLIADEPTTLLDLRNREQLRHIFAELSQQVIVVTHDLGFIRDFDRVLWIDNHTIREDGPPAEVIAHYERAMIEG